MNKIYNEDIKNKYLEKYSNEETNTTFKYLFYNTYLTESTLQKDLYDFNLEEIKQVLMAFNSSSVSVTSNKLRMISLYIRWAIENNYRQDNINPLAGIDNNWIEVNKLYDSSSKQYFSKNELYEMIGDLVNYQDKIVPILIFNGVYGHESSEIRNLKMSDVDTETGKVRLYDDVKGERYITVDEETIEYIEKAYYEKKYYSLNGTTDEHSRNEKTELRDGEYVVRTPKRGRGLNNQRVSQMLIIKRVKMLSDMFNQSRLTPKSISRSGMIYMTYKLMIENGLTEATNEILEKVAIHFNWSKVRNAHVSEDYTTYNYSYARNFIKEDTINELYLMDLA